MTALPRQKAEQKQANTASIHAPSSTNSTHA